MAKELTREEFRDVVKNTPLVSIDLIIRTRTGKVLLGKRLNKPAKGSLFVPGGRIRKDEKVGQAFERIAQMELGRKYPLHEAHALGVFDHIYDMGDNIFDDPNFRTHYVVLGYELLVGDEIPDLPKVQ